MNSVSIRVKVDGEELAKIMDDLAKAQETIYNCYSRLNDLGVLEISEKSAASGN